MESKCSEIVEKKYTSLFMVVNWI